MTDRSQPSMIPRSRRIILLTLKAIVGIALMYFVLRMVDLNELLESLKSANLLSLGVATSLLTLNLGIRILKWKNMLRAAGNEVTAREAATSVFLGITFGSFTPGQLGELGGRFLGIANGKSAHIIGLTILDRTQIFLVLAMSGLTSYAFLVLSAGPAAAASVVSVAGCLFLYVRLDLIQKIFSRVPLHFFRKEWLRDLLESFNLLGKKEIVRTLLYSLAFNFVLFLQMFFFLNAFGSVDPWTAFIGFSAMMFFKSLLPLSIGDIGIREASTLYFFSMLGVSNVVALSAALMMFTTNMILPSLVGVFFLPSTRFLKPSPARSQQ
ncbi:MAG: flippase-like domain-containing protein [Ignavibacteriales bacterium]|nr:flippase-like domain-containing protein [Ignavibacteriales bacterium]